MSKMLGRTKDIFLDTMLLGDEILLKKIKNTNKVKITVALVSYRNAETLERILTIITNQTFSDYEVIVVDDLVEQNIEEYINELNSNNVNYIKKQLGSNSSAKNLALEFSKGEYIIFIEEAAQLEKDYLEKLYNAISKKSADIAIVNKNKIELSISNGQKYLIEEIVKAKQNIDYNLTSFMFKKKFLEVYNLRFDETILALESLYFKLQCLDIATKIVLVNDINYKVNYSDNSIKNTAMIAAFSRRIFHVMKKIEIFKVGKSYESYLNLLCGYLLLDIANMQTDEDEKNKIFKIIKDKKYYFEKDSFVNKTMLSLSIPMFVNYINNKEKR